jgi:hypothetical protein
MNKRKWSKSLLLFAVFTLTLLGFQQPAFCTGGSGGDGGDGGGGGEERDQVSNLASYPGAAATLLSELSFDEIKVLMHGLDADVRTKLLADTATWPPGVTVKQLIDCIDTGVPFSRLTEKERDSLLVNLEEQARTYNMRGWEHWSKDAKVSDMKRAIRVWEHEDRVRANRNAGNTDEAAIIVDNIDWVGQQSQAILAYCPVGLLWAVLLDTGRAGAEEYKKGSGIYDIGKAAVVDGAWSYVTNTLSKADKILDVATTGAKEKGKQLAVYLGAKFVEGEVGDAVKDSAANVVTAVTKKKNQEIAATVASDLAFGMPTRKNKATGPTYMSSSGYGLGPTQHKAQ